MKIKKTASRFVPEFISRIDVETITTMSRSTIYGAINPESVQFDPTFPKPYRIGSNKVGWKLNEVQKWCNSRTKCEYGDLAGQLREEGK